MELLLRIFNSIIILGLVTVSTVTDAAYSGPITTGGLNLIKEFEEFCPNFHTNPAGIKTIGYGYACNVNKCDKLRPPLTESQAITLLKGQIKSFENCVNQNVKCAALNAAQFSSLVSFSFNLGCDCLKGSTLLTKLNKNDIAGAAAEFPKWNKVNGKVLPALTKRRKGERALFCSNNAC